MAFCPLCRGDEETVLWRDALCRITLAADPDYAGFCRVIWNAHAQEMSDLVPAMRERLMFVVFSLEQALRELMRPDKINLASFGNQVPHVHWHVIPRFRDDAHFPDAIWAPRRRDGRPRTIDRQALARNLKQRLGPSA